MISQAMAMAGGEGQGSGNPFMSLVPFLLVIVIFYFLLIRPQQKRQKDHRKLVESLTKGDKVVTSGGIHGTVVGVKEDIVVVKVAENVKLEISKGSVAAVVQRT